MLTLQTEMWCVLESRLLLKINVYFEMFVFSWNVNDAIFIDCNFIESNHLISSHSFTYSQLRQIDC